MTKFNDLKLHTKVLKAIDEAGYTEPTPIQAGAIPPALEGRDVLGIAQTGTGKTASFTLPMITALNRGRARARMPRSLVLAPTRELAAQVAENFDTYAKYTKLTKALLIGGVSFKEQDALIDRGVDVLIATPGRLLDHFERGKLILSDVKIMVVDEADRMLDMGFIPDIEKIFQLTPFTRQTLFFSATMAPEIERITNTFLSNPARIEVARQATTSETITQAVYELPATRRDAQAKAKREFLRQLIEQEGEAVTNGIIFCNRKVDVDIVAKSLKKHGYNAEAIHGDLDQSHRTRTLDGFRDGNIRFLVASDVAARGLDIPNVSHVFNFDVPSHSEDYVHRIGRTGRAGRTGTAMMIATTKDDKLLAAIESLIKTEIPRGETGSAAPKVAPSETETEEKPKASKSRSRSRRSSRSKSEEETAPEAEPAEASEDAATQAIPDKPQQDEKPAAAEAGAKKPARSRGGRGRGRGNQDKGPQVMGLGDHLPDFIAQSFEQRRAQ
ncbi:MAG: DEAD/DEAH box helicase [Litoreibacter sp.]|nr:DEAD/DEAH box helicase [Litoreibacter sp.]